MKEKYLQIAGAFLLGLLIPWLVLRVGGLMVREEAVTVPTAQPETQDSALVKSSKIRVVMPTGETVEMEMESYLVGVVLAEMPTSYVPAALQAQSIVARTYALKRQQEERHPGGAICTDFTCCQAYISQDNYLDGLGYQEDIDKTILAVEATAGQVLTYRGELIEATYFSCSGGRTEDSLAVWGVDYPYLQAVESPGEENMENYSVQVHFSREELEKKLGITLSGTPKSWLGWTTYTTGGGVDLMFFAGIKYSGLELRKLLGLNSTAFKMQEDGDGILVTTSGKGHRVGMSQSGAQAMAAKGSSCGEILAHYYPGTTIDKWGDLQ